MVKPLFSNKGLIWRGGKLPRKVKILISLSNMAHQISWNFILLVAIQIPDVMIFPFSPIGTLEGKDPDLPS